MKSKKVTEAKTALQKKIKEILSDKKNANGVLDLLQILSDDQQESSVDPVSKARKLSALKGLVEIFTAWIKNGDTKVKKDSSGPSDQLASWILERLDEFWAAIAQCLSQDDDETLQEFALVGGFRLLQAGDPRWTQDSQKRLRTLVLSLCSSQRSRPKQIRRFQEFLEFLDVKQHTLTTLQKHVRHQTKKNSEATEPFKQNVMTFLEILGFSKLSEKQLASAKYLIPRPEHDEEASFHFDYDTSRKAFSDLWEQFLKLKLDPELYKRVLIVLSDKVMPHLLRPLLLTDFLMNSYAVGGPISILSLNGVFTLMTKHNLEFPDFYKKLYQLFQPDILHVKYRARFFYMSDLFLSSSHLPSYLVAAFVKRLARMALTAPPNALLVVFPFISNLLIRHKGLTKMIHGRDEEEVMLNLIKDRDSDPFDMEEPDPSKCRAIDSCLWEIQSLTNHVLPQVAQSAKALMKKLPEMEFDLSEFLEFGMDEMFHVEARKKIFVNVPLTFERPAGMKFAKMDLTGKYFQMC